MDHAAVSCYRVAFSGYEWVLMYSMSKHGASLSTLVSKTRGLPSSIIFIETTTGACRPRVHAGSTCCCRAVLRGRIVGACRRKVRRVRVQQVARNGALHGHGSVHCVHGAAIWHQAVGVQVGRQEPG